MNDNGKLRVVLATHNAGKIRELADPMADFGIEVVGLSLFPEIGEIEETGTTFEENALIKARAEAKAAKNWAEADRIRDELKAQGIELIDTKEGTTWKRV